MNRKRMATLAVTIAVAGGVTAFASLNQDPAVPGGTKKDAFPNGCVSCHVNLGEGADHRLSTVLAAVKGHPKLSMVATVPTDCGKCHKAGAKIEGFNTLMHRVHYGRQEQSEFVKRFEGACLNCHALDAKTGALKVKAGPKNW